MNEKAPGDRMAKRGRESAGSFFEIKSLRSSTISPLRLYQLHWFRVAVEHASIVRDIISTYKYATDYVELSSD